MKSIVLSILMLPMLTYGNQNLKIKKNMTVNCESDQAIKINMSSASSAKIECVSLLRPSPIGETCKEDANCQSKCCDHSAGVCMPHDISNGYSCAKAPGQTCYDSSFCRKENIPTCLIVKTGVDTRGNQSCTLRCYNKPEHGLCENNICIPAKVPAVPYFDPSNPDCSSAVEPPIYL